MADRSEIIAFCDELLGSAAFQDVAVNGLQVEGRERVDRIAVAVSTSEWTIRKAIGWNADALLVHHGMLWGSRSSAITGLFARRLRMLFRNDINLIGYHLPLDAHESIGNCALLASNLGYTMVDRFAVIGGTPLGVVGETSETLPVSELASRIASLLGREPTVLGADGVTKLKRVGFLTGSGYSAINDALEAGCDALVTGDVREPTMAEARELGLTVIAAGHEATERFGVQALAEEISGRFDIKCRFFDDPNPI